MKKLKMLGPILFLLLGAGGLVSFELYFKDKINTVDVVVAKNDINFKDKITEKNLKIVPIRRDNAVEGVITPKDVSYVINKNAAINIKKGTQIYSDLVDEYNLVPNEKKGEFIAPIPNEWLFAVPGSLRRTFIADFYAIPDTQQAIIRSMVKQNSEKDKTDKKDKKDSGDTPIVSNDEVESYVTGGNKPILTDIRVASVKDDSNKEVMESKDNKDSATGKVSSLEIIGDEHILSTLQDYTQQGYKIYVVYKFNR